MFGKDRRSTKVYELIKKSHSQNVRREGFYECGRTPESLKTEAHRVWDIAGALKMKISWKYMWNPQLFIQILVENVKVWYSLAYQENKIYSLNKM